MADRSPRPPGGECRLGGPSLWVATTDRYVLGHEGSGEYAQFTPSAPWRRTQVRIRIDTGRLSVGLATSIDHDVEPEDFVRRWFDAAKAQAHTIWGPFDLSPDTLGVS